MSDFWIVPDEGKSLALDELFRLTTTRESFILAQFIGGGPVTDASTFSDFTLASYTGYSSVAIARAAWGAATVTSHIGSIAKSSDPVFTCTGGSPQTVNGLILYGATSGKIYVGVNYSTPIVMASGTTDTITPLKIQDKTFV